MVSQMVIGPGSGELQPAIGIAARERRLVALHRASPSDRCRDRRHVHDIAVVADPHPGLLRPVDALDLLEEAVNEVDAGLLAVRDDVDAARSFSQTSVASFFARSSAAPSRRHAAQSFSGSASQAGFGRLPAIVVSNMMPPFVVGAPELPRLG
jgi:hypothetical protein